MPRLEGLQSTQLLNAYPDGKWHLQPFKKTRIVFEKQTLWTSHKLEVRAQEEKNYMKKRGATYSGDGGAQLERRKANQSLTWCSVQ